LKAASGHSRRRQDSGKLSEASVRNLSARSEAFLEAVRRRRPEHSLFPQAGLGTIIPFVQNIAAQRRSSYWNTLAQSASPYRQRNVPSGMRVAGWPVLRMHQA
jgi:hypothetical protein